LGITRENLKGKSVVILQSVFCDVSVFKGGATNRERKLLSEEGKQTNLTISIT
jgi:hypothetical protein